MSDEEDDRSNASSNPEEEGDEAPDFALNPAQATGASRLNYRKNKMHRYHYTAATRSLYDETSDRFNLTQDKLHEFLSKIHRRANAFALSTIDVPIDNAQPLGDTVNLASEHGEVTMSHLQEHAATFMGQHCRAAQDDYMLLQMLMNSCSEDAQAELADHDEEYKVDGDECGVLLLQVIMREASIEVSTDPDIIRQELALTHQKFKELNHDVSALNKWVTRKLKQLRANGETSDDLRTHLFKAYRSSPDKAFTAYIRKLKDDIRDGGDPLSAKALMSKAKLKVTDLQQERALDATDTHKDEQLLALEAKLEKRIDSAVARPQQRLGTAWKWKQHQPAAHPPRWKAANWQTIPSRTQASRTTCEPKES